MLRPGRGFQHLPGGGEVVVFRGSSCLIMIVTVSGKASRAPLPQAEAIHALDRGTSGRGLVLRVLL